MNIRFNTMNAYRSTTAVGNKVSKSEVTTIATGKKMTDKITISADATDYAQIAKVQNTVVSGVKECGSAERISELKKQIAEGTYSVSSKETAERILGRYA